MVTSVDLGAREYYTPSTAQTPILAALPSGIFEKSSSLVASAAQRGYFDVPVLAFFFLLLCVVRCVLFREPPPRIVSASFPPPRGTNGVLTTGLYSSARRRIGTWYRFRVPILGVSGISRREHRVPLRFARACLCFTSSGGWRPGAPLVFTEHHEPRDSGHREFILH